MGSWFSGLYKAPEPPEPPKPQPASPKLLKTAWRKLFVQHDLQGPFRDSMDFNYQNNTEELKKEIADYKPLKSIPQKDVNINFLNIMLIGPAGAGKSSFLNSIHSALLGRIHSDALAGSSNAALTKKFTRYPVAISKNKKPFRLKFSDMRGLEETYNLAKENIQLFLLGHIADDTLFEQADAIINENTPGYVKSPKFDDRTMCCIIVVDASQLNVLKRKVYGNIKGAQCVMNDLDIMQIVVLTKIDKLCTFTNEKITNAFYSNEVKRRVEQASSMFEVPENHVFPVKNYVSEVKTNTEMDAILLFTLNEIIQKVESTLVNQYRKLDPNSDLRLWRTSFDWGAQYEITEEIKRYFDNYRPAKHQTYAGTDIPNANLLLFGPVGAGKSSFVNSVQSVFRGEFAVVAKSGRALESETKKYKRYQLDLKGDKTLPIRICDMPGLEKDCQITDENANLLLNGNIRENMTFVPNGKVTIFEEGRPDDRIACVIIVIDASVVDVMSEDVINHIQNFQKVMKEFDVKEVVLLTKVDTLLEAFRMDNVPEIFQNKKVEKCVKTVAKKFNVSENYVFPIKNYTEKDQQMNDTLNVLIFQTMKDILKMAETTLDNIYQDSKQPELCEEQWRTLYKVPPLEAKSKLKKKIEAFEISSPVPCVNILLLGPEGAGKSSFINTIFSVIRQKIFETAFVGRGHKSKKKYKGYKLPGSSDKNDTVPITLYDTRGFGNDCQINLNNLKPLLEGNVNSDTCIFDTKLNITEDFPGYKKEPSQNDRFSIVVIVIDAFMVRGMPNEMKENIQSVLDNIEISSVIVLTKIDRVCRYTEQNVENAFKSLCIKNLVLKVTKLFEINSNRVLPMKNYESEMQLHDDIDIVALFTLYEILKGAESYLTTQSDIFEHASKGADRSRWREAIDDMIQLRKEIDNYAPVTESATCPISKLNILCIGPVGSGKSSFINTVMSVLQEQNYISAKRGDSEQGTTKKFMWYQQKMNKICLRFYDMRGLLEKSVLLKDNAKLLLRGHIANNTNFDISSLFTPETRGYVKEPSLDDKIVGVVVVISADMELKPNVVQNIKEIIEVMEEFNIPHVIVLTKIDKICEMTKLNASNAFVSKVVETRVKKVAEMFDLTSDMVHPMKNYGIGEQLSDEVNHLTLHTLKQILDVIKDGLDAWQAAFDE